MIRIKRLNEYFSDKENSNNNTVKLIDKEIRGRILDKEESNNLKKEIESYYTNEVKFGANNNDIRQSLFNLDNPLAEKVINGKKVKIVVGLIRDKEKTYLLYIEDNLIGEFFKVSDIKEIIKHIEKGLISNDIVKKIGNI